VAQDTIAGLFNASAGAAALIGVFCSFVSFTWAFAGIQYVANASFNNLGKAHWSTVFNWAKATVGTIPFVYAGAAWAGAPGVLIGMGVGSIVFGIATGTTGYRLLARLDRDAPA
jgi:Na+-driven multidrug efflux pump